MALREAVRYLFGVPHGATDSHCGDVFSGTVKNCDSFSTKNVCVLQECEKMPCKSVTILLLTFVAMSHGVTICQA